MQVLSTVKKPYHGNGISFPLSPLSRFAAHRVERNDDVNETGRFAWSALHLACQKGETPVVESLMARGASMAIADTAGYVGIPR